MKQRVNKKVRLKNNKQAIVNFVKKVTPQGLRLFLRKVNYRKMYIQAIMLGKTDGRVFCPIDQKSFKVFPNGITITNGARSRHRLFWLFLERETDILTAQLTVLHVAPQYGIQRRLEKCENLTYIPCDKFLPGYDYQKNVQNVDLLDISFDDNHFDYIICNRVLEHIEDDVRAISEMYRVLKPGGVALLSVPIDYDLGKTHESYTSRLDRIKYYGQWDHVRMYSGDIKDRIESVGFSVEMNMYSDNITEEEMKKFGLSPDTIIIARKATS